MKRNIPKLVLLFTFLIIFSGQIVLAQTAEETAAEDTAAEKTAGEEGIKNILSELPDLPVDYTEINAVINGVIFQKIDEVIQFIKKYLLIALTFFLSLPALIKTIVYITMFPAAFGIIASHVLGIYKNRNVWQKHLSQNIMYSYFIKSGTLQRKKSYKEARTLLRDRTWFLISFAGLAYRLGNYINKSTMLMFVLSFAYLPMSILGIIEMIIRIIFGTIWLIIFNLIHSLILLVTKIISLVMIPVSLSIDKVIQLTQYCPHCYETFEYPNVICPSCGAVHKKLLPGNTGALFVRCGCNKKFLPCTSFTGRQHLVSKCPSCAGDLAVGNSRHFSLALIGGNHSGKTAFLASLSNIYMNSANKIKSLKITGTPETYFNELSSMFSSGKTESDSASRTYSLVHTYGKENKDNLSFYDTQDEEIISGIFPRTPKYFGFCDGVILVLDPLSTQFVRKELVKTGNTETVSNGTSDDLEKLVVQFIRKFTEIRGFSAGKMSDTPIAILINKIDVDIVTRELGQNVISGLSDEKTVNDKCRDYLLKIGLINVLNNIEAAFTNISFFPVSTIGHAEKEGIGFSPIGVVDPLLWIAKKRGSNIVDLLNKARNENNKKVII